jgi:hypothetical protein
MGSKGEVKKGVEKAKQGEGKDKEGQGNEGRQGRW